MSNFFSDKNNIRVRRRFDGQSITGKADFFAPQGLWVALDSTDMATPSLKKASGTKGFMLGRPIVSQAEIEANTIAQQAFPKSRPILNPDLKGSFVSASKVLELEVEGLDLVQTSGTGALSASTVAGTELGLKNGRHYVKQSGDEVNAILRAQLPPHDSANVCRLLIEVIP